MQVCGCRDPTPLINMAEFSELYDSYTSFSEASSTNIPKKLLLRLPPCFTFSLSSASYGMKSSGTLALKFSSNHATFSLSQRCQFASE